MSNTYDKGDVVRVTGTLRDSGGVAADPAALAFKVKTPAGTVTTYTYGTDAQLVKESTGIYRVDLDANLPGTWHYRFESTGTGQGAGEDFFNVRRSEFVT